MVYDFVFKNFAPDENLEIAAHGMIRRVAEIAPYGASCNGSLERVEGMFHAELEIRFPGGRFEAEAKSDSYPEALDHVECATEEQIARWRQERFFSPAA